ncbi:hypothetical protein [Streptomyces sp. NPDC054784]
MTPAEEIAAAARKLRAATFTGAVTMTPAVARLIAVQAPLAAWLMAEAQRLQQTAHPDWQADISPHAYAIAREINKETP